MPSLIHQPHDKLFKLSMEELPVAREFFQNYLPPALLVQLDLQSLKLEKQSFIDERYRTSKADLIYSVRLGSARSVERMMPLRLLIYMTRMMQTYLKQHPKSTHLPLIFPVIVYTGYSAWQVSLDLFCLFQEKTLAKEWFLNPHLLDINRVPDGQFTQKRWCNIIIFAFKLRLAGNLELHLKKLFNLIKEIWVREPNINLAKLVIEYALDSIERKDLELFKKAVRRYLPLKLGDSIMPTIADMYREEGMQQGIDRGVQQGQCDLLIALLKSKFGTVPAIYLKKIKSAPGKSLLYWSKKMLKADMLEEVFATPVMIYEKH